MRFGFDCGSYCLTYKLVLAKYVKKGVNIKFITILSVKLLFLSCKGVHGGQIQPVTTRLRVNIREFILYI